MSYEVEQIDKDRAREDVVRLWRQNLPVAGFCDRKFEWTYERAPEPPLSPLVLVDRRDHDGGIVGTAGVARRGFVIAGEDVSAGLLADLAVDRAHRTALPALILVRRCREAARSQFVLAYGFPNHKAEGVFLRAGYTRLGGMARYVRVLRHEPYMSRHVRWRRAARAAGRAVDAGASLSRAPLHADAAARYRLVVTETADERADLVWRTGAPRYAIVARRSVPFLRWRLAEHPEKRHRFVWLETRRGGAPRAYAAIADEGGELAVRDFFGPPEALQPLFERLAGWARAQGARSLALRFLGDPRVTAAIRSSGFRPRGERRSVVVDAFAPAHHLVYEPSAWFLTDADEDI